MSDTVLDNNLRTQFNDISKRIMPMCGLIYELYQQRFSVEIDSVIDALPIAGREFALELARNEFDYLSPSERETQIQGFREDGLCSHGLDPDCCPCGCGM
ncbi:CcgAII protein [Salmonella enterica]|nr:CcgAII protein [Salmonella enterica]